VIDELGCARCSTILESEIRKHVPICPATKQKQLIEVRTRLDDWALEAGVSCGDAEGERVCLTRCCVRGLCYGAFAGPAVFSSRDQRRRRR